jgi:asparagine synthase (glutamine-hydrolysing)
MCGIAGVVELDRTRSHADLQHIAHDMAATLQHRGPDDEGVWVDAASGVALGHRRLSILDLSAHGHQPMASHCGRYVVVFNGELYNVQELRTALAAKGHRFHGHCDTEVLVQGIVEWSLNGVLKRSNGMFALAVWDRQERVLQLARDRLGEKPLYYGWIARRFVFGSELQAILAHPDVTLNINRDALAMLMQLSYVPAPHSIYSGISKLPAGTTLAVKPEAGPVLAEPAAYWSLTTAAHDGLTQPYRGGEQEATDEVDELLRDSVRLRREADVPLGTFLSGGVDSSTVAAVMAAQHTARARTFTVGFDDADLDEAPAARAIAAHLGTQHTEITVTADDALALVPRLPHLYDEPFADPSQLPTTLISAVAREHVTVCLSGDGGDEVFAGYNRYLLGPSAWRRIRRLPRPARLAMSAAILSVPPTRWDKTLAAAQHRLPSRWHQRNAGTKLHKLGELMTARDQTDVYRTLVSQWRSTTGLVLGAQEPSIPAYRDDVLAQFDDPIARMQLLDGLATLPDEMLVKVDRASMSVGLEVRLPLLDHRLVELAWRLPSEMKVRKGQGKWILRRVLNRYVPPDLLDRPKMGFDPPISAWLRGPLREWASDLLSTSRLLADGYLQPEPIQAAWNDHLSGRRNNDYALWAVLMFQAWHHRTAPQRV